MDQSHKIDKVTCLVFGIRSFVEESIKSHLDLISEAFDILENVHKIGTHIRSFKELLTVDTNHDE